MNKLKTNFCGIDMKNPIMTASGTFGWGKEYSDYFDPNVLGAIVLKGLTLEPRKGNPGTRIAETPSGMLNSIGLENPGFEHFKNITMKELEEDISTNLIVNLNGKTIEEYVELTEKIDKIDRIAGIELNISCPNVKDGGMAFGANPKIAAEVTRKVREVTKKPLIVKLSPNVTDISYIAKLVEDNGADAIAIINTLLGMAIDIEKKKPVLGNIFGGFSGPAVKPVALRIVYQVYKAVNIPILGMGGISSTKDAIEFMMAGASAVSLGTSIFTNPLLPVEVIEGLNKYCKEEKLKNISDIVGILHK
ncbi:dihydroorotate dehydrogenase (NAD+) catalytic subunit [Hypnocyclicus thermotrophus]|uniref:Dihydroorotate dehydrogenase n=1 Tax=Hypnocyclicus thermotrophus TaxID=1627895 RepID=A0AA46DX35_9FUSO|nr:dihydroorotate dehydrogenase [Hypnocyclicus thermotrophus]TDT67402.1 dihydroorotate dehydrogenase (NAD+) catalytic subunit [Hypnocyclicus thermotrophus]